MKRPRDLAAADLEKALRRAFGGHCRVLLPPERTCLTAGRSTPMRRQ